jgi:Winged helix DNA-binding domain
LTPDRLSLRALNRATLERQLLLRRAALAPRQAVEHLAGLQAQAPLAPYVGLWTRLAGFRHQQLKDLLTERAVVRAHLMRNTVHLVTAEDFVSFRPLFQPKIDRDLAAHYGRNLTRGAQGVGVDLAEVRQAARALLAERPLTRGQLAAELAPRWPDHDPTSLAYAATHLLSLVQVPPRGLWGETGQAAFFLADAWLDGRGGSPPDPARPQDAREQLVMRYLAAYGPASVRDIQAWSGLSKLREVTERLCASQHEAVQSGAGQPGAGQRGAGQRGARLRMFTGPDGGQLLDLPDAPVPDPDTPAPPRFLPEYDNLLLSFADRSRVIPHRRPVPLPAGHGGTGGTLLVDGFWQADWKIVSDKTRSVLEVRPFIELSPAERDAIAAEGELLLGFAGPAGTVSATGPALGSSTGQDVRFAPVS